MIVTRLSELLKINNISINELSDKIHVGRRPLTQLANNESKMVKFETIEKIMSFFQLSSFDELLSLTISNNYQVSSKLTSFKKRDEESIEATINVYFKDTDQSSSLLPLHGNLYTGSNRLFIDLTGEWDEIEPQTSDFLSRTLSSGQYNFEVLSRKIALSILSIKELAQSKQMFSQVIFKMPVVTFSGKESGKYLWNADDLLKPDFLDLLNEKYSDYF